MTALFHPPGSVAFVFHPFANLFPMLADDELAELAADMKANGQAEPCVLHRGMVLDGRNRTRAAALAGIGVSYVTFSGSDRAALDYVISKNLKRRHLTTSQRAMIAAKLATLRIGDNQHSAKPAGQGALALDEPPQICGPSDASDKTDEGLGDRASAAGHTVSMTTDHATGDEVGTCECGAVFRVPLDGRNPAENLARAREMDAAIEGHWHEVLQGTPAAPASVSPLATAPDSTTKISTAQAAHSLAVSTRSVEHAAAVRDKGVPELADAVTAGTLAVSTAAAIAEKPAAEQASLLAGLRDDEGKIKPEAKSQVRALAKELRAEDQAKKKVRREEKEAALAVRQLGLPDVKAGVILEDFEWDFEVRSRETGMDRHAANHYPTAETAHTPEEIVERTRARFAIAAPDCVLYMWATNPHLAIALKVMELRGFRYVSNFAWGKSRIITGYWNRGKHELLLIGTRGSVPCPAMGDQYESLQLSAPSAHSEKPDWAYEMIEKHFPNVPKVELNARRARPGWIVWGNEAPELELAAPAPAKPRRATPEEVHYRPIGAGGSRHCLQCKFASDLSEGDCTRVSDAGLAGMTCNLWAPIPVVMVTDASGKYTQNMPPAMQRAAQEMECRSGGSGDHTNGIEPLRKTPASPETNGSTGVTSLGGEQPCPPSSAVAPQAALPRVRIKQAEACYSNVGVSANRRCGACIHFVSPCACQLVIGLVSPAAICDLFERLLGQGAGPLVDVKTEARAS